jgi:uncharacterized membrane-anchored protein YjiN (DUF445 family)
VKGPSEAVDTGTAVAAGDEAERARDLARMKRTATGFLVAATVVFVVARVLEPDHGWLGYVRATAEAAMVGALADWFAVTALFRYPLGLPIPHTAIIPNRKDDIGRGLGTFVQQNFLTREVVADKLSGTPIAVRLGGWLAQPANAARVGEQLAVVVRTTVEALRDEEVQDAIETAIARKVRATPAAPLLSSGLDIAIADGRHQELFGMALRKVGETLEANRDALRRRLGMESPWWVPETLDDRVFAKLFEGVQRLLADVAADPDHELRSHFDERVQILAADLKTSAAMRARAEELKEELLDHPSVRAWSRGVWADLKHTLLDRTADPSSELRRRIESGVIGFGERLRDDPSLQRKVDDWITSAVVQMVEQSRGEIGDLISTTVERWNPEESTRRIELQVGRDLQFIRINGTIVGGLVGLIIHTVSQLVL